MIEHDGNKVEAKNGYTARPEQLPERPKAPNPSADPGIVPAILSPSFDQVDEVPAGDFDVTSIEPLLALKVLARGVQGLVDITGDVPPTPIRDPSITSLKDLGDALTNGTKSGTRPATPPSSIPSSDLRDPKFRRVPIGSPEATLSEPTIPDASKRTQQEIISRKFFSKKAAPVTVDEYLLRLHRYCPMSTAVYLAAGAYIYKIAVLEKTVPVTSRTVHRLLVAALRVAMKALEDLSYPHRRFAGVGGVGEKELAKLEISLCYLTNFELRINNEMLLDRAKALLELSKAGAKTAAEFRLSLPTRSRRSTFT